MWSIGANASKNIAPANWSAALAVHLEVALQGAYSIRLYGRAQRTPVATLKVLWLDLLPDRAV